MADQYSFDAPIFQNFNNLDENVHNIKDLRVICSEDEEVSGKRNIENEAENKELAQGVICSEDEEVTKEPNIENEAENKELAQGVICSEDEEVTREPNIENEAENKELAQEPQIQEEMENVGTEDKEEKEEECIEETITSNTPITDIVAKGRPTSKNSIQKRKHNVSVRQSPRLADIAKSIRRSNASRGFLPSPSGRNHRRSLSEGSNIVTHFSRVEKKTTSKRKVSSVKPKVLSPKQALRNNDDLNTLGETAKFRKLLAGNAKRKGTGNISSSKPGPLKATAATSSSIKPLKPTKPAEFYFATDKRVRNKSVDSSLNLGDVDPCKTFKQGLRSYDAVPKEPTSKGPTKVHPFNLHGSTKPKENTQCFLSMAELNMKFYTTTPQRFRTKRANSVENLISENKKCKNPIGVTQPHTPQLTTKLRARPVKHPTREEIETEEINEAQKHQFKAKPLNKKILDHAEMVEPKSDKPITIPMPFDITDMKNEVIKEAILGSNVFSSSHNLAAAAAASSLPHDGLKYVGGRKSTRVTPFSFDSRDSERLKTKKEKIEKLIDEEKKLAEFHAHPMPAFERVSGVPAKNAPAPTKPQPFNMMSDQRRAAKLKEIENEIESMKEMEKQQREFTAQPAKSLIKAPFVPEKSNKPLTDISVFTLNSDKRAVEREEFNSHMKQKEDELAAKKRMFEEEKAKREEEEVQKIRKEAVHKAQPIRKYKPLEIQKGVLPPTVPVTPKFAVDEKLRSRTMSKLNVGDHSVQINDTFTKE